MTSDLDDIAQRNSLRRDAGLPRLDVAAELEKLESIRFEAAFEREFESNRLGINHLWADKKMGGLSRMGLWNRARAEVRHKMSQLIVGKH